MSQPIPRKGLAKQKKIQYLIAMIWNVAFLRMVPNGSPFTWSQIFNEEPLGTCNGLGNLEPLGN